MEGRGIRGNVMVAKARAHYHAGHTIQYKWFCFLIGITIDLQRIKDGIYGLASRYR